MKRVRSSLNLDLGLSLLWKDSLPASGLTLESLIDTCSKVHDNAQNSSMQKSEASWDRPLLNGVASQLTFIAKCPELMKTFSERKGLKPVSEIIQIDSMNEALRASLWNALDVALWSTDKFIYCDYSEPHIQPLSRSLWFHYFKKPIDSRPDRAHKILAAIREYFFSCQWHEVYDFLEFIVSEREDSTPRLAELLNAILERELSGYRFVTGHLADVTSREELAMIEEAARDSRFPGVSTHIDRALELYADRENPDYRNSIKESISAVESMARLVSGNEKASLGDALKTIEKNGHLHPALKEGFLKLYGYTSDEQGIRHAMLDEPNLTAADARYFLVSCSSFVNYLKTQIQ